jgi:hypothetical protein
MVLAMVASANSFNKQKVRETDFPWMFYLALAFIAIINIYFILLMILFIIKSQIDKMGEKGD